MKEPVYSSAELVSRFHPIRSQWADGNVDQKWEVRLKGIPTRPYLDELLRGMIFNIGEISCGISNETLARAGYGANKLVLLAEVVRRFEKKGIELTLDGMYDVNTKRFAVDYGKSMSKIVRALKKL